MLAGSDELDALFDFRSDDLNVLIEALSESNSHTFSATVLYDEYITIVSSDEFLYALVRHHDGIRFAQTDIRRYVHTRTKEILGIRDDNLTLESVAGGVNGRINDFHRSREHLIRINLRCQRQLHAGLEEREIGLRDSDQCFQFVNLSQHQNRLTAVELPVLVVLGGDDACKRSLDIGVSLQELQLLLGGVILGRDLVILLLGSRTGLEQHLDTVLLDLEVCHGDLRSLVLGLIHAHEVATSGDAIAYLAVDMLDLARQGRCYVLGDITLKVRRDGYLTLDLAGL